MRILTSTLAVSTLLLASSAGASLPLRSCPAPDASNQTHPLHCGVQQQINMEIVFVLDTTGSMGGLIDGAKQKIWSIASTIAQSNPNADIRMGLVAYKDRGDNYVTNRTELTDDLDKVYSDLMSYVASGGGDGPESVNEALYKAVERTAWSDGAGVLRVVYLVGDAPPHMDYQDDVKYPATCKIARENKILINTILCGSSYETEPHWRSIAQNAKGTYARIAHDSGVVSISTPYDEQIAQLEREHASLMIDYGDASMRRSQLHKRSSARRISSSASPEALADRAAYAQTLAGSKTRFGEQELVNDLSTGEFGYADIDRNHLPEHLRSKSTEELRAIVEKNASRRAEIDAQIRALLSKRGEYVKDATPKEDSFDAQILISLEKQAKTLGITLDLTSEEKNED